MAGRLSLIKSMIESSFIHSFMIYKWPSSLIKELNISIRNFLWSGNMFKKKIVTVAWNKVCCPSEFGGLDIRDIAINNESLLKKFSWDILTKDSFSMKILRARFLNDQLLPNNRGYFSSIFPGIRQLIIDLMQDARWLVCDNSRLNA